MITSWFRISFPIDASSCRCKLPNIHSTRLRLIVLARFLTCGVCSNRGRLNGNSARGPVQRKVAVRDAVVLCPPENAPNCWNPIWMACESFLIA
jgi:hypothetical protein